MLRHPIIWLFASALVPNALACANDMQPEQAAQTGTIIPIDSSGGGAGGTASDVADTGDTAQTGVPGDSSVPHSSAGAGEEDEEEEEDEEDD